MNKEPEPRVEGEEILSLPEYIARTIPERRVTKGKRTNVPLREALPPEQIRVLTDSVTVYANILGQSTSGQMNPEALFQIQRRAEADGLDGAYVTKIGAIARESRERWENSGGVIKTETRIQPAETLYIRRTK